MGLSFLVNKQHIHPYLYSGLHLNIVFLNLKSSSQYREMLVRKGHSKSSMTTRIQLLNVQERCHGKRNSGRAPLHKVEMLTEFGKEEHRHNTGTCSPSCTVLQLLSSLGRGVLRCSICKSPAQDKREEKQD